MNLKVGDTVLVKRAFAPHEGSHDLFWAAEMDECVGKKLKVKSICGDGYVQLDGGWWFYPFVLEKVEDRPKSAHILTEKIMVGDTPCRKILGFEGILGHDELPDKYLEGTPRFVFNPECNGSRFIFNGEKIEYVPCAGKPNCGVVNPSAPCGLDAFSAWRPYECLVKPGDVLPEPAFQELLTWLKRAGSRLAKIRKQEKAAWSGKETIEI